jgi:small neutral amino acid transporter SnatA (MarC family)
MPADGTDLARDMVSQCMELIIVAMGIQFALKGCQAFMA